MTTQNKDEPHRAKGFSFAFLFVYRSKHRMNTSETKENTKKSLPYISESMGYSPNSHQFDSFQFQSLRFTKVYQSYQKFPFLGVLYREKIPNDRKIVAGWGRYYDFIKKIKGVKNGGLRRT